MTLSTLFIGLGIGAMVAIGYELRDALRRGGRIDCDEIEPLTTQDDFHAAMQRKIDRDQRMRR